MSNSKSRGCCASQPDDVARTVTDAPLPAHYTVEWLSPETPTGTRTALADTAIGCGVLPPSLEVLSGDTQPAVCVMAKTSDGRVAACAAAASLLHPEHPDGASTCWWGMLAVHPEHRGQALSLTLGAMAMLRMREVYGFTTFFTGVTPGNTASEVICRKLGLAHEGRSIVALADPALLPDGQMTK